MVQNRRIVVIVIGIVRVFLVQIYVVLFVWVRGDFIYFFMWFRFQVGFWGVECKQFLFLLREGYRKVGQGNLVRECCDGGRWKELWEYRGGQLVQILVFFGRFLFREGMKWVERLNNNIVQNGKIFGKECVKMCFSFGFVIDKLCGILFILFWRCN